VPSGLFGKRTFLQPENNSFNASSVVAHAKFFTKIVVLLFSKEAITAQIIKLRQDEEFSIKLKACFMAFISRPPREASAIIIHSYILTINLLILNLLYLQQTLSFQITATASTTTTTTSSTIYVYGTETAEATAMWITLASSAKPERASGHLQGVAARNMLQQNSQVLNTETVCCQFKITVITSPTKGDGRFVIFSLASVK